MASVSINEHAVPSTLTLRVHQPTFVNIKFVFFCCDVVFLHVGLRTVPM